ncbi:CRISPR type III-B/RAMP module RAMP protein Cmr4 [Methanomethylovorans hollandica DSM 15978]|uniref:CRISPR type III-B/RAMP module RAMP protein Cmr4 n=1 Tax=Methanomethylovorans hollandica (strain DSM 15978 / NBRC 107637 / DMS1) TaxID=867904 RepID=L0KVC8_METHD|nr:type III-B CRISPR module RAMP protein Cmr4 [Methanomethylovorans hollandica]AGB49382.1 CRISPR type III-B/RAMP module RAMP protein Cmr4 [Methanomethylovorans hollandica DSM 15978]
MTESQMSYQAYEHIGLALDPIHVGTGGNRLGRVDNTIIRDPVTKIPKIPGSSLAGVLRTYVAMSENKYPDCAGQGQPRKDGTGGHCGQNNCPVCTTFGFAKGNNGGFAGLASFNDMHVLLFPVATCEGPFWVTAPIALRQIEELKNISDLPDSNSVYCIDSENNKNSINFGWLLLPKKSGWNSMDCVKNNFKKILPENMILGNIAVVSDKLFSHIVNSNLEVRTSVSINPATGAAEDGALFTYEALPRGTILHWIVICRNPNHFKIDNHIIASAQEPRGVHEYLKKTYPYLEYLGIGGMTNRGMGRLRVLNDNISGNIGTKVENDNSQMER